MAVHSDNIHALREVYIYNRQREILHKLAGIENRKT